MNDVLLTEGMGKLTVRRDGGGRQDAKVGYSAAYPTHAERSFNV